LTARPTSRWLLSPVAAGIWLGVVLGYLYVQLISLPSLDPRIALLAEILRGEAKADYLYATYALANVHGLLAANLPLSASRCFALIDFAGIVFMFACAACFVTIASPRPASRWAGLVWLTVTSPLLLFQHHFYHPSDFYATGLMFLILLAAKQGQYLRLAALCFLSGMLWEKTLFVPFIYLLCEVKSCGVGKAILRALPAMVTTLFCFGFWRVWFPGAGRLPAFETWSDFSRSLVPAALDWFVWLAPLVMILANVAWHRRRLDPFWWYWLLYLPLLVGVIVAARGHLRELRSFWILQPIFVGLIVSSLDALATSAVPAPEQSCGTPPSAAQTPSA
jgi:hypothetical protein